MKHNIDPDKHSRAPVPGLLVKPIIAPTIIRVAPITNSVGISVFELFIR